MSVNAPAMPAPQQEAAPQVSYQPSGAPVDAHTLAVFGFGEQPALPAIERAVRVPLASLRNKAPLEFWKVDAPVQDGRSGRVRWSAGGGWLFALIEIDEDEAGGPNVAAREAYAELGAFLSDRTEHHVLRMWNYMQAINAGEGDAERYKQFCDGRIEGMAGRFEDGFPAATAIGHHEARPVLQVYCLASNMPGTRVENPRQMSAWRYPRCYGPTSPSFARAMRLPGGDALAISGTAAITGHASRHHGDVLAQLNETLANLDALLASGGMPAGFDARGPLKVYVRHAEDADRVEQALSPHLHGTPYLLLQGDVCRAELLVEIDGWRYA